MSGENLIGLVVAISLFVYLGVTLIFPERF
jgi:K+-transporting ATPase KdpF subunit